MKVFKDIGFALAVVVAVYGGLAVFIVVMERITR